MKLRHVYLCVEELGRMQLSHGLDPKFQIKLE